MDERAVDEASIVLERVARLRRIEDDPPRLLQAAAPAEDLQGEVEHVVVPVRIEGEERAVQALLGTVEEGGDARELRPRLRRRQLGAEAATERLTLPLRLEEVLAVDEALGAVVEGDAAEAVGKGLQSQEGLGPALRVVLRRVAAGPAREVLEAAPGPALGQPIGVDVGHVEALRQDGRVELREVERHELQLEVQAPGGGQLVPEGPHHGLERAEPAHQDREAARHVSTRSRWQ